MYQRLLLGKLNVIRSSAIIELGPPRTFFPSLPSPLTDRNLPNSTINLYINNQYLPTKCWHVLLVQQILSYKLAAQLCWHHHSDVLWAHNGAGLRAEPYDYDLCMPPSDSSGRSPAPSVLVQSSVNVDTEVDLLAWPSKGILRAVRAAIAICNPKTGLMDLKKSSWFSKPRPKTTNISCV